MSDKSGIEWTDATWNPVRGCSRITTGCGGPNHEGGCYAEKIAARFSDPGQSFHGFAERTAHGGRWTGKLALIEEQLALPLRWKKPRKIFVNSMSDLFHENLPDEAIDKVFAVMALAPQHTFQVLTKRAERMRRWFANVDRADHLIPYEYRYVPWPLANVWLGVSAERQQEADERIPLLLQTPAAVRFVSAEPLLGPIDLSDYLVWTARTNWDAYLNQVIAGGESGQGARPMHPDWVRSLRDQCADHAQAAFFFKQCGEWFPCRDFAHAMNLHKRSRAIDVHGNMPGSPADPDSALAQVMAHPERYTFVSAIGKKAAGRLLDGRTHDAMPGLLA